jgi:NADH:ubiquinone oxidoreductase subunit E
VPDTAFTHFAPIDLAPVDEILKKYDFDQKEMLGILESIQRAYGYLPVAALMRVSEVSGAPYALIYGTATYYRHLRFDRPGHTVAVCLCTACLIAGASRVSRTIGRELGAQMGRGQGGAGVALEQIPAHIPGAHSPLVTLDGKPQAMTPAGVAAWARALSGRSVA